LTPTEGRPSTSRTGPALILLFVPFLLLAGIMGVHGGGRGTAVALVMSLISVPVGALTMIWGLSTHRRSFGWWFVRVYLLACSVALALAVYDLTT
jgi:hypothetical protein